MAESGMGELFLRKKVISYSSSMRKPEPESRTSRRLCRNPVRRRLNVTESAASSTVRFVPWLWEYRMSASLRLLILLQEKHVPKTGNKPGVTKGKQWIRLNKNLELLDTPGILWPKFEDQKIGERLALIGSINDEILHVDELAVALIRNLKNSYLDLLEKRYDITIDEDAYDTLKKIAIARKCLQKGELPDVDRASSMLLEDFRSGKLGRITLERPEEWQ